MGLVYDMPVFIYTFWFIALQVSGVRVEIDSLTSMLWMSKWTCSNLHTCVSSAPKSRLSLHSQGWGSWERCPRSSGCPLAHLCAFQMLTFWQIESALRAQHVQHAIRPSEVRITFSNVAPIEQNSGSSLVERRAGKDLQENAEAQHLSPQNKKLPMECWDAIVL